jgi:CheY-like chemotaxis protein
LYVEDDDACRELARDLLIETGARVAEAASVADAMVLLDSFAPDVLVSDLELGEEDGVDLIRRVRARPPQGGGEVPAIALTGHTGQQTALAALRAGFNVHIAKPIEAQLLAQAIANVAGAPLPPTLRCTESQLSLIGVFFGPSGSSRGSGETSGSSG